MLSLEDLKPSPQCGQHWVTDITFRLIFLQFPVEIAPFSHIRKQLLHWSPPACASTINTPGLGTGIRGTWEARALSCVGSGREKHCPTSLLSASRHRLALLPTG